MKKLEQRKMSKKSRLFIILAVLAICFAFLWPSISWYARTPKEMQALALGSLEKIKDYSSAQAAKDVKALKAEAKATPDATLTNDQQWLAKAAKKNYKEMEEKLPSPLTIKAALVSFSTEKELTDVIETRYRDRILKAKNQYKNSVKLGLDLNGGMNVIVKADLDAVVAAQKGTDNGIDVDTLKKTAMTQAIETLTSRIDKFGLSEPVIRQQGEDRIYIELPGAAEADQINSIIMGRGILNFRLVDSDATTSFKQYYAMNPESTFDSAGNLIKTELVPADDEVMGIYSKDEYGLDQRVDYVVVKKEIAMEGKHIKSADVSSEEVTNKPEVIFTLDSEGAKIFGDFTTANVNKGLAIISDNKVKSYANISEPITEGRVRITGFSSEEAQNLQKVLQTAWLDVPLTVESQQVIGASLGKTAIRQGILALAIGLLAILIFMIIYYKGAGINACVAQILNLYIMFSILRAFNLTITLPSIAGMILTIGMAVDANVIIFERIKEELRLGKDRAAAINAGFDNAFWAIMDSNITTFIAAIFMSQLGSGSIQGFAVSLAIGVVSSVFTALVVSRLMFDFNTEVMHKQHMSISWSVK